MEKPQSVYHQLKLHPFGEDKEAAKERGDTVTSQQYEEIVFNEPAEAFFELLTSGPPIPARGKGASKVQKPRKGHERTAENPINETALNPFSQRTEAKELDRLSEAQKQVKAMIEQAKANLQAQEKELEELRKLEGVPGRTK